MLLIVTNSSDATVDFAMEALAAEKLPFWRLDTDLYPYAAELNVDARRAQLTIGGQLIDFAEVNTVWWRRPVAPVIEGRSQAVGRWAAEEARLALDGAWRGSPARWVNHPDDNRRAQDKLGQLRGAASLGFSVPEWLVTNQAAAARDFARRHPAGVIAKPLSGGALDDGTTFWTTLLTEADLAHLGPEPYLLQRYVERQADLRVVVVGDELFAVAIDASAQPVARTDWRRAGRDARLRIAALDDATRDRCLQLCRANQLAFAAIDFAFEDGQLRFFEINPNGQWAWLQEETGVAIAQALARLLAPR